MSNKATTKFPIRIVATRAKHRIYQIYAARLSEFVLHLQPKSRILELGYGCGYSRRKILSENFSVTGVDISPVQIERAKNLVPNAEFIRADMTEVDFPQEHLAAIVSLYAIIPII